MPPIKLRTIELAFMFALIEFSVGSANKGNAILNVMKDYQRNFLVHAHLCWEKYEEIEFIKVMSQANVMVNIHHGEIVFPPINENHLIIFLVDLSCDNTMIFLQNAEKKFGFASPFKWIMFDGKGTKNANHIENLNILSDGDVNVLILDEGKYQRHFSVYKNSETEPLTVEDDTKGPLAVRRKNLHHNLLRICYVITNNDTFDHLYDYGNQEIDTITKVNFVLTNHLADYLNASREFSYVNTWGYKEGDTWSGMIGKLTRNEADVGGSPLFFTADRVTVIDYLAMTTATKSKFVFKQPKLSYMSNVFVLPFQWKVWASSIALIVFMIFFLYISSMWEWIYMPHQADEDTETVRPYWSDVAIMTIGAACQQGSATLMRGIVGRIVILLLFLSLMFLYASYSANIVALLQSSSSRIKSLSDLLNSGLKMGVHDTIFNRHYFSTATEPVRKAIYLKKIRVSQTQSNFIGLKEGIEKLRTSPFAFHMETGVGYKVLNEIFKEEEKCGLQEIQYLQVIDPWLAVRKNSTYKEAFKVGLRKIQEHGLQYRETFRLYTKKPKCAGTGSMFISVGLVDCRPAMMALAYGAVASLVLLLVEQLVGRDWKDMMKRISGRWSPKKEIRIEIQSASPQ